ncbi:MAG: TonB-dependent receptor [Chitinophagaceae bacterium]
MQNNKHPPVLIGLFGPFQFDISAIQRNIQISRPKWGSVPKVVLPLFFLLFLVLSSHAQRRYTLNGYLQDSTSGEALIGANVYVLELNRGISANSYGFYSITLPQGNYHILFSFLGYSTKEIHLNLNQDMNLNEALIPHSLIEKGITVSGRRKDNNITGTNMGKIELSIQQMKSLPAIFGETDILRDIQLLPGIQSAGEGNTGFYVRGGGPDQNLILLDDAPVYNTGHLFGFFSIFNGDAINNVTVIKGGMPANYGGRLSSVVNVSMKEGNNQKLQGEGGIGLIASRFSLEGPLVKGKSSFMISARRTYIDILAKPFVSKQSSFYGSGYYFYDLNAKVNYSFSEKDHLFLSGYFGRDVFNFRSSNQNFSADIPWGNSTATLRWNHIFNKKLFANAALIYNDYHFSFGAIQDNFNFRLSSGIRDENAKMDFDYFAGLSSHIKFGFDYIYHSFFPNTASGQSGNTSFSPQNAYQKHAQEIAEYFLDDVSVSKKFKMNLGMRYSFFQQIGPYTIYQRNAVGRVTDSTVYRSFQPVQTYSGWEPRLIFRYLISDRSSLKAAVTKNYQYIHLVSNSSSTLPTDLWVPSTYRVKPEKAWQYDLGYYHNFHQNTYETSLELYYKQMQNQVEFQQGYTPSLTDPENSFVFGKGWSYGAEIFLHKQRGKFTGWVGYTLSWTWRQFPDLNNGKLFPAKFDRRHDLSVVGTYFLNPQWSFSAVFIFASGNATTIPNKFYFMEGVLTPDQGPLNAYRLEPYDRLDFSAHYSPRPKPGHSFHHSWVFSVYNVYSRLNPYFIYFSQTGNYLDGSLQVQAKQVSLFPVLPSVTWNFKF